MEKILSRLDEESREDAKKALPIIEREIEHVFLNAAFLIRATAVSEADVNEFIARKLEEYQDKFYSMTDRQLAFAGMMKMIESPKFIEEMEKELNGK